MFPVSNILAAVPAWIADYLVWWVAAIIVVGGLAVFGRDDLPRLHWGRVWAISSVSFSESIRRRVLWVTPLAILGVIIVAQLQHSLDEQETVRQTTKFCLFASGLLVTITAVILACTNLPREIESRVIFTIVTKPTTRLEIVLGKVLGFIRVSGLIVIIMGLFTFGYLEWRAWRLNAQIAERLKTEQDTSTRQTLLGYQSAGLLSTKSLEAPVSLNVFEQVPVEGQSQWISGGKGYFCVVPFAPDGSQKALIDAATEDPPRAQLNVVVTLHLKRSEPTKEELKGINDRRLPVEAAVLGPAVGAQEATVRPIPQLSVQILGPNLNPLIQQAEIHDGKLITVPPPNPDGSYTVAVPLPPEPLRRLVGIDRFFVQLTPETPSIHYEISSMPIVLLGFRADASGNPDIAHPEKINPAPQPGHPDQPTLPQFLTQTNRYGYQVAGSSTGDGSVAVYAFRNVAAPADPNGIADFRFRAGIERGGDFDASQTWSNVSLEVFNRQSKESSGPIVFHPETNRDFPIAVPARFVAGGNFDVYVRGKDNGQWIGMTRSSVEFISAEHWFGVNLFKSLLILWLMSVLVVVIAVFTSTFLSWPIAVVLTLVLLLGHWGVEQLGDALNPGVGRSVAGDLGFTEATQSKMVSASVDALAKLLTTVSAALPDLGRFPVMDDITRGVNIPPRALADGLGVLACYGLPLLVLSFVILKNKEVAP